MARCSPTRLAKSPGTLDPSLDVCRLTLGVQSPAGCILTCHSVPGARHQARVCVRRQTSESQTRRGAATCGVGSRNKWCGWIQLDKRNELAAAAAEGLKEAKEAGDDEAIEKFAKRTVRITRDQVNDVKKLLVMMGLPIVEVFSLA